MKFFNEIDAAAYGSSDRGVAPACQHAAPDTEHATQARLESVKSTASLPSPPAAAGIDRDSELYRRLRA